jgi:hypothetical protein
MVSKTCLPYLKKSAELGRQPHILTISPPLTMDPKWFGPHTAYTSSKYGMSMVSAADDAVASCDTSTLVCMHLRKHCP